MNFINGEELPTKIQTFSLFYSRESLYAHHNYQSKKVNNSFLYIHPFWLSSIVSATITSDWDGFAQAKVFANHMYNFHCLHTLFSLKGANYRPAILTTSRDLQNFL